MNEQVKTLLDKYPPEITALFLQLRELIWRCAPCEPEEALWARMPTYTAGDAFIRLIPFRNYINVEARAVLMHREELSGCKITPKGMLQVFPGQTIAPETLQAVFTDTLRGQTAPDTTR